MTLVEVKEYLKTVIECDNWYVGKIDKCDQCIGVFLSQSQLSKVSALGGKRNKTYDTKCISLLIHWTDDLNEAEKKALEVYNLLDEKVEDCFFIQIRDSEPKYIDTDNEGIHEFVINLVIYEFK